MIFCDTTVLSYAVGSDHQLREPCQTLVDAIGDGDVRATTTAEVIQEFTHVFSRRRSREHATRHARRYAELLKPLFSLDKSGLYLGLDLYERYPTLGAFDCMLAATAIQAGAEALVSSDRGFSEIEDLRHVFPDAAGIAALVGRH